MLKHKTLFFHYKSIFLFLGHFFTLKPISSWNISLLSHALIGNCFARTSMLIHQREKKTLIKTVLHFHTAAGFSNCGLLVYFYLNIRHPCRGVTMIFSPLRRWCIEDSLMKGTTHHSQKCQPINQEGFNWLLETTGLWADRKKVPRREAHHFLISLLHSKNV